MEVKFIINNLKEYIMKFNLQVLAFILIIFHITAFASNYQEDNKINLNTAKLEELVHIVKGIGIKRAESIILYRKQHGKFSNIEDIANVPKIGKKFVNKNIKQLAARLTLN